MASKSAKTFAIVTPAQAQAIAEFREAKRAEDAAKRRTETAKAFVHAVFDAHGSPDTLQDGLYNVLVTRSEVTRTSLDAETVKRYAPKTYARALRTSTFPRLTLGR